MKPIKFLDYDCELKFDSYSNNKRVCLSLVSISDKEPIVTASVNLPMEKIASDEIAIKNYSENEGILQILIDAEVVSEPIRQVRSGYVLISICKLLVPIKKYDKFY